MRIVAKIEDCAKSPLAFAKVKTPQGRAGMRLRIGQWRVIFETAGDTIIVKDVGDRSRIYD